MLDDPSLELRRDAVAAVADQAAAMEKAERTGEAVAAYRRALSSARDLDQIQTLAGRLRGLHQTVDLPRHFGFIVHWQLIGPLDNTGHKGFDAVYPPEREVDLSASYPGKHGTLHWVEHVTKQDYGMVDFNQVLGEEKSVVGYAATTFVAAKEREVEFRLASFSAVKLWLNGQLIDQHNVYHNGSQMDQYVSRGVLRAGPNRILVKACQTNLTQEWARVWQFQLRVCDQRGTAVLSADRRPPAEQLSGKQGNTGFRHDSIEGPKA
jgi:hypothetical protein